MYFKDIFSLFFTIVFNTCIKHSISTDLTCYTKVLVLDIMNSRFDMTYTKVACPIQKRICLYGTKLCLFESFPD